jgi:aspartate/methionine/tyrosine aminotransferase
MRRFPHHDIVSLVDAPPRLDLAESVGPDLQLRELWPGADDDLRLGYGTAAGDPALRAAIARAHGVAADEVLVTVGGIHALFLLAFTLCEPGDEAVVADPVFPLARSTLQAVGAVVKPLPFRFDDGYQPDLGVLASLLTPRTRLVSLASPQNPSGVAIAPAALREIVALVQQRAPHAWLVLDETYREASHGDDTVAPSALQLGPRVLSTASLSKTHGAAGLRIGWLIARDAELRATLLDAKFSTVIACSTVDEALALQVLARRDAILAVRRQRLHENRTITGEWVQRQSHRVEWVRPDAGALCCVRLRAAVFDEAAVERFHAALPALGVRVAPGPWFGEAARVFRLGFGVLDAAGLSQALAALASAMDRALSASA